MGIKFDAQVASIYDEHKDFLQISLHTLPKGKRYEDTYGGWIKFFEQVANLPSSTYVEVMNCPASWAALLMYLGCSVVSVSHYFDEDRFCFLIFNCFVSPMTVGSVNFKRTDIDALCSFRPETADCLWKVDNQWHSKRRTLEICKEQSFIISNNAGLNRPEVMHYITQHLHNYIPFKRRVLMVPCSADKPYPSGVHELCDRVLRDLGMRDEWYLMVVTGVLGLVPEDLWDVAPDYDTGIPNRWRVLTEAYRYFGMFSHDRAVAYMDFYTEALDYGTRLVGSKVEYVFKPGVYDDYADLLCADAEEKLRATLLNQTV